MSERVREPAGWVRRPAGRARELAGRALPGPWGWRTALREGVPAVLLGGLAALTELGTAAEHPWRTSAIVLAVVVLYLLRRGLPGPVLVLTAAGAGGPPGFIPLLVAAGYSAGRRIARPAPLAAVFGIAFAALATVAALTGGDLPRLALLSVIVVSYLLLALLPALFGRYRAQRRTLLSTLRERNEQLLRERAMIVHQARLRERHRIAQDMHDSLGHQLALISVHTGALEVDRGLGEHQREAVAVLRQAATGAMRELREVVGLLRDDSLSEGGGIDAVERLADTSRAAGTAVALRREGAVRPLAAATGQAAFRIVQEGLTNAHKHAPAAAITVAVRYEPDALVVEVVNGPAPQSPDGAEAPPVVSGGQGLAGLRERARLLGGIVHAGRTPDGGYRIAGLLPYESGGRPSEEEFDPLPPAPFPVPSRRPALGCAVGAVGVLVVVVAVLVWGSVKLLAAVDNSTVPVSLYDSLQVGTPEQEADRQLPVGSEFLTSDFRKIGPQVPAGAHCRWFGTDQDQGMVDTQDVVRFCFRDGVLIEKQHFRGKV